jgi:hypothetical protein
VLTDACKPTRADEARADETRADAMRADAMRGTRGMIVPERSLMRRFVAVILVAWSVACVACAKGDPTPETRRLEGSADALLSENRPEGLAVLEQAARQPGASPRTHGRMAYACVARGDWREALEQLDAAGDERTVALCPSSHPLTLVELRAIATWELGRHEAALRMLGGAEAIGEDACLAGDLADLGGDPQRAEALWTRGSCMSRLAEGRARRAPFDYIVLGQDAWSGLEPSRAVAAAMLGAQAKVRDELDVEDQQCRDALTWRTTCLRVGLLHARFDGAVPSDAPIIAPSAFRERPAQLTPYDDDREYNEWPDDVPSILDDWFVARIDRKGSVMAAIAETKDDVGSFLLLSRDGGRTFEPPVAIGLNPSCGLRVRAFGTGPILDGARVQVEVLRYRGDETDPEPVLLAAPLAEIVRDSDGDGLPDGREIAWRTDPFRADTDGDGVPDSIDRCPRVPPQCERPEIGAFLEFITSNAAVDAVAGTIDEAPPHVPAPTARHPPRQEAIGLVTDGRVPLMFNHRQDRDPHVLAYSSSEIDACANDVSGQSWNALLDAVFESDGSRATFELRSRDAGARWLAVRDGDSWQLYRGLMWVE